MLLILMLVDMQCKDIPDLPVLEFLIGLGDVPANWWFDSIDDKPYSNSVLNAMPTGTVEKLARAKMGQLIRRDLVQGCTCGCRGDFRITNKGRSFVENQHGG